MTTKISTEQIILTRVMYSPKDIAYLLRVSDTTVYRWVESGKIIPTILSPLRFSRNQVFKLIQILSQLPQ